MPRAMPALERLCKWRSVFAGWQLGTRSDTDGPTRAVRDHRELSMVMRVELSAIVELLIERGIITRASFTEAVEREAVRLDRDYQQRFPGFESTDHGMALDPTKAQETMRRLEFPP